MNKIKKKLLYVIPSLRRSTASIALLERLYKLRRRDYDISLLVCSKHNEHPLLNKVPRDVRLVQKASPDAGLFDSVAIFGEMADAGLAAPTQNTIGFCQKKIHAGEWALYLFDVRKNNFVLISDYLSKLNVLCRTKRKPNASRADEPLDLSSIFPNGNIFTENFSVKAQLLRIYPRLAARTFVLPDTVQRERIERLISKPFKQPGSRSNSAQSMFGGRIGIGARPVSIRSLFVGRFGAMPDLPIDFDGLRILTIAPEWHLSHADHCMLLHSASLLLKRGFNFKWYVVCEGADSFKLNFSIKQLKIENCIEVVEFSPIIWNLFGMCDLYISLDSNALSYGRKQTCFTDINTRRASTMTGAGHIKPEMNDSVEAALILGMPVIAPHVPLYVRLLEWEDDTIFYEPDDPSSICDAIEYVCNEIFSEDEESG